MGLSLKVIRPLVVFASVALVVCSVWADEWTDPVTGCIWKYTIHNSQVTIAGENVIEGETISGGTTIGGHVAAISPETKGTLEIPSVIDGNPVVNIKGLAFCGCYGLTSVIIPSSITNIETGAFEGCSGLNSFTVAVDNAHYKSEGGLLLTKNATMLVAVPAGLRRVVIPSHVTKIGDGAFFQCSALGGVTIPLRVTSIGDSAFAGCDGLTSMTLPASVTKIGAYAFWACTGLKTMSIPRSVTAIEASTFKYCSGLTRVSIPSTLMSIGSEAFYGCSNLSRVTIPASVTNIDVSAFHGCDSLKSIVVATNNARYKTVSGLLLTKDGRILLAVPEGLDSVKIPSSVTTIGATAFSGCSSLSSVTIPVGVTTIEDGAFSGCSNLTSVIISSSVTSIGSWAFSYCSNLAKVSIPSSVTNIADRAFHGCAKLKSLEVLFDNENYKSISGLLLTKDAKTLVAAPRGLPDLMIPPGVTNIGSYAFSGCHGLESVVLPSSVKSIGDYAFFNCISLNSLCIPRSVEDIGHAPFSFGSDLLTVHVEEGDADRVRALFNSAEATKTTRITLVEDYNPNHKTYDVLNESDIIDPFVASTTTTLVGIAMDGDNIVGRVEIKLSKVNVRKGTGRVSCMVVGLDGKRHAAKTLEIAVGDGGKPLSVAFNVRDMGVLNVTIGGKHFAGSLGSWHVQSANVGGEWKKEVVSVDIAASDFSIFTGRVVSEFLPSVTDEIPASGSRWLFAKPASIKWAKPKRGAELTVIFDEITGKGLIVDMSRGKTNLSGLNLVYSAKKGMFKGTFKIFELQGEGRMAKLRRYTIKVQGLVVDGVGYGRATCMKPVLSWPVTIK